MTNARIEVLGIRNTECAPQKMQNAPHGERTVERLHEHETEADRHTKSAWSPVAGRKRT